jgi:hypothetical protein
MSQLVNDDPRDTYGDTHNWRNYYTHQWAQLGGRAHSEWECLACNAHFTHYYHEVPNIRQAMRDFEIVDICPKAEMPK